MKTAIFISFLIAMPSVSAYADHSSRHIHMMKTRGCACCTKWGEIARANGFEVTEDTVKDYASSKRQNGIPFKLAACHTAKVGGYVVEGHVPMNAIEKLLNERPKVYGISVPGMPGGSPGMGYDPKAVYDVYSFDKDKAGSSTIFMRMGER